jgi:ABC-2 type transport system permease protein
MKMIGLIIRRELSAYFTTPLGWSIVGLTLLISGILFGILGLNSQFDQQGVPQGDPYAMDMFLLQAFFFYTSIIMGASTVFITMRLFSDERASGTLNLLFASTLSDASLVLGKFFASLIFLGVIMVLSLFIPIWIAAKGDIPFGMIVSGYLGMLLFGGACLSLGIFFSSVTNQQIVAALSTAVVLVILNLFYFAKSIAPEPYDSILRFVSIWNEHFASFRTGEIKVVDLAYYLGVMIIGLTLTTKSVQSRRWK